MKREGFLGSLVTNLLLLLLIVSTIADRSPRSVVEGAREILEPLVRILVRLLMS